jgi:hypothetical protein
VPYTKHPLSHVNVLVLVNVNVPEKALPTGSLKAWQMHHPGTFTFRCTFTSG